MNEKNMAAEELFPAAKREQSAAERLGRALLDSLGPIEGADEDELVDAMLREWNVKRDGRGSAKKPERKEAEDPFRDIARPPVPMRTGSSAEAPVDYSDMSRKQFSELRKLLKKAAADGRRIRI